MVGFIIMLVAILACVILWAVKATNDENELLRNKDTAASSTNNETQTTEDAPLTREELDRLLFKYHDKLFGTIVKAILMAMLIWSAIGGIVAAFIVAASVH